MEQVLREMENFVAQKLGAGYTVTRKVQTKNNGVVLQGFMITKADAPTISPVLYVNEYATAVYLGRTTAKEAADAVVDAYRKADTDRVSVSKGGILNNRLSILNRVVYHVVNAEMNSGMLSTVPHKNFLDLAAVYRIKVSVSGDGYASAGVSSEMCKALGITEKELDDAAKHNTAANGFIQKPMGEILEEITGIPMPSFPGPHLQVFTSKNRMYGATALLYPDVFKGFADSVCDDLFILPSSIHELIAVPAAEMSPEELRHIVGEVNAAEVAADEILSENVYCYDRITGEIRIA